jgi:hypothetical protein
MDEIIKTLKDFGDNDFLIKITPRLDSANQWDGEVEIGIVTSHNNNLSKDDFSSLLYLATMVSSSVALMEEDDNFRDELSEYTDELMDKRDATNEEEEEESEQLTYGENVVHVDFRKKH